METIVNNTVLYIWKWLREQILKVLLTRKKIVCNYVWWQILIRHCGDHFTIYTSIESLGCTPETKIMLYVNYTSIKNKLIWCIKNKNLFSFYLSLWHPGGSDGKESACNSGDPALIPGLGRSPGEGNGYPFQYSCLENSMDKWVWRVVVHVVTKSWWTQLKWLSTHT